MTADTIMNIPRFGEILALGSGLVWAAAVILFRISGRTVPPLGLNLFKSMLAVGIIAVALVAIGDSPLPKLGLRDWGLLLVSGILGVGLSDTLFFACLNRLGAGLTAIVDCSYSPSVILLAALFLAESMTPRQILGAGMIILAVILVTREKNQSPLPKRQLLTGVALGVSAMFLMGISVVIMKPVLSGTSVLWATEARILGGILFLSVALAAHPRRSDILRATFSAQNWKPMIPGSVLGGFAAQVVWMGGMKFATASVSAALNQLTSVFIFVFGVIFLKEQASRFKLTALGLAVAGAVLVTFP